MIPVLSGDTSRQDIYQATRFHKALEKNAKDTEAVQLEIALNLATSAAVLAPAEVCKQSQEQLAASWQAFTIVPCHSCHSCHSIAVAAIAIAIARVS